MLEHGLWVDPRVPFPQAGERIGSWEDKTLLKSVRRTLLLLILSNLFYCINSSIS